MPAPNRGGGARRGGGGARGRGSATPRPRPEPKEKQGYEKEETIEAEGTVTETLPNAMFRVQIESGPIILAQVSGKMRLHFIKILPGDRVRLELSPYDLTRGRIQYRYK